MLTKVTRKIPIKIHDRIFVPEILPSSLPSSLFRKLERHADKTEEKPREEAETNDTSSGFLAPDKCGRTDSTVETAAPRTCSKDQNAAIVVAVWEGHTAILQQLPVPVGLVELLDCAHTEWFCYALHSTTLLISTTA